MKLFRDLLCASLLLASLPQPTWGQSFDLAPSQPLREAFAAQVKEAGRHKAAALAGADGWLFLTSELRFLSVGQFWGETAAKVSQSPKPDLADPLPAIVDFQQQLKAKGIELILVPVPPKAAVYREKIVPGIKAGDFAAVDPLRNFYLELKKAGVEVVDLAPFFTALRDSDQQDERPYCQTDTHWSPAGCEIASVTIAHAIEMKLGQPAGPIPFKIEDREAEIEGDLVPLLPPGAPKPGKEKLQLRQISVLKTGAALEPDPHSPILLMGDSHTLVFHDFAGERAGLFDQLALELHAAPDLIGTRGSGSTAVRVSLYRKTIKDPEYLAKKKVVVWCFTAREFTESDQGWAKVPISK